MERGVCIHTNVDTYVLFVYVCVYTDHNFCRRLLHKDKNRREKRKSLINLTASEAQLGKHLQNSRAAMAAVAALSSLKKSNNEASQTTTSSASKVSRWKRNRVHPSNDLKADAGNKPSLNRTVSNETQSSVVKSQVTLHSLATGISGVTSFGEMGSDISAPSSITSQFRSRWPSAREILSSNSQYCDDASSILSEMDSGVMSDESSTISKSN